MDFKGLNFSFSAKSSACPAKATFPSGTKFWTWDPTDVSDYTPQGITSFSFVDGGTPRELVLVSWYLEGQPSRISYLELDSNGDYQYGYAILVHRKDEVDDRGDGVVLHAGGLAFHANKLLVADTKVGILSFDAMNPQPPELNETLWRIFELDRFYLSKYVPDYFSFMDIAWTQQTDYTGSPLPPYLLTGMYVDKPLSATHIPAILGWQLDDDGPLRQPPLLNFLGDCPAGITGKIDFKYMQGVAVHNDTWYVSQSGYHHSIRQITGALCPPTLGDVPVDCSFGLEDLHIPKGGCCLRGLTEKDRFLFEIPI